MLLFANHYNLKYLLFYFVYFQMNLVADKEENMMDQRLLTTINSVSSIIHVPGFDSSNSYLVLV